MSFETFVEIFHKLPRTLTQIAFGADATLTSNPDIWKMFEYCRSNDYNQVIPNVTVANIDAETAKRLASVVGAVAVSRYSNKNWCYDSIKNLADVGMTQRNIHQMISVETYDQAIETVIDYYSDPRLAGMNAIVFLSLKQVGRGKKYTPLPFDQFQKLIDLAFSLNVKIGFDSCTANNFFKATRNHPNSKQFETCIEPCESTCFSLYINQEGKYFPCSFSEGNGDWVEGIDITKVTDFNTEVWHTDRTWEFRDKLLSNVDENGIRACPLFKI
jgi:hypothetical protein